MNFDYTYVTIFGLTIFEPMVFVTNSVIFLITLFAYRKLAQHKHSYATHMGRFLLFVGTSSLFGAVCHMAHLQMGQLFFDVFFFIMNALNLISIYYCFRAPYTYVSAGKQGAEKYMYLVQIYILLLIGYCIFYNHFIIVKINAALVLIYSLIIHIIAYKTKPEGGNKLVIIGILISFSTFVVHTLKISLHEWFNYKDISHVIIMVSLAIMYLGAKRNSEDLDKASSVEHTAQSI